MNSEHPTAEASTAPHASNPIAVYAIGVAILVASVAIGSTELSPNKQFAAENFMSATTSAGVAWVCFRLLWLRCRGRFWEGLPDNPLRLGVANFLLAGVGTLETGFSINRTYWLVYRVAKDAGYFEFAALFDGPLGWISALSIAIMVAGGAICVGPVLQTVMGRHWFLAAVAGAVMLWMVGYQIPLLVGGPI